MHAGIRKYSGKGARELLDVLEKNSAELQSLLRAIEGFVGYTLVRTGDGGMSLTVCQDKAGIEASSQTARDWIAKNAASLGAAPPEVTTGEVIIHMK